MTEIEKRKKVERLTTQEVAQRLDISERYLQQFAKDNNVQTQKFAFGQKPQYAWSLEDIKKAMIEIPKLFPEEKIGFIIIEKK
ncbi:MAG: hypothetical protein ACFE9S_15570 [Candidatus Hermodarchaeota archaeon]